MQMNVSLPAKMYEFVQGQVKTGMYSNASEVVRDALRRLDEEQRHDEEWKRLNAALLDAHRSGTSSQSVSDVAADMLSKKDKQIWK